MLIGLLYRHLLRTPLQTRQALSSHPRASLLLCFLDSQNTTCDPIAFIKVTPLIPRTHSSSTRNR